MLAFLLLYALINFPLLNHTWSFVKFNQGINRSFLYKYAFSEYLPIFQLCDILYFSYAVSRLNVLKYQAGKLIIDFENDHIQN